MTELKSAFVMSVKLRSVAVSFICMLARSPSPQQIRDLLATSGYWQSAQPDELGAYSPCSAMSVTTSRFLRYSAAEGFRCTRSVNKGRPDAPMSAESTS